MIEFYGSGSDSGSSKKPEDPRSSDWDPDPRIGIWIWIHSTGIWIMPNPDNSRIRIWDHPDPRSAPASSAPARSTRLERSSGSERSRGPERSRGSERSSGVEQRSGVLRLLTAWSGVGVAGPILAPLRNPDILSASFSNSIYFVKRIFVSFQI